MKKLMLIIIASAVLLLAAGAGYYFFLRPKAPLPVNDLTNLTPPQPGNATNLTPSGQPSEPATIIDIFPLPQVQPEEDITPPAMLYHNFSGWYRDDILEAYAEQLPELNGAFDYHVRYLADNQSLYIVDSVRYKSAYLDPFWIIRSKYVARVREFPTLNLRINVPITSEAFHVEIMTKRNDTRLMSLHPETYAEWSAITCERILSCRDIYALLCVRGASSMVMWTPLEAEAARDSDITFTFQGNLKQLAAFERFYCEPA
ncbi:MAG: hypothetical protein V1735_05155 [Nanoarchaeota archaeon]